MYKIASGRYLFNIPISVQEKHLMDVWHLTKVHKLTLLGVKIGEVFTKTSEFVEFNVHRFGRTGRVKVTQINNNTVVDFGKLKLNFIVEPTDEGYHYLNLSLLSNHKWLFLFWPLIQIMFFLTIVEDRIYYE